MFGLRSGVGRCSGVCCLGGVWVGGFVSGFWFVLGLCCMFAIVLFAGGLVLLCLDVQCVFHSFCGCRLRCVWILLIVLFC